MNKISFTHLFYADYHIGSCLLWETLQDAINGIDPLKINLREGQLVQITHVLSLPYTTTNRNMYHAVVHVLGHNISVYQRLHLGKVKDVDFNAWKNSICAIDAYSAVNYK